MKFLKSISLFFFIPIICFVLGAFVYSKYSSYFYPSQNDNKVYKKNDEKLSVEAQRTSTDCDTQYIIKEYDLVSHTEIEKEESIPLQFMGLNREELIIAIQNYELSPTFGDLQNGFQSMELTYFSPEKIEVKKSYKIMPKEEEFYLKVENNKIVVYQSDMETIYMYTEMELTDMPDDLQQEIINVKCINNLEALYDFLESHSS